MLKTLLEISPCADVLQLYIGIYTIVLWKYKEEFDYSGYPKDSPYYDETNKKVVGKFKDESNGKIIKEFIGIK